MSGDTGNERTKTTSLLDDPGSREASVPADLQRGDVLAARYEIEGLLGRGGMASVYRAYDRVAQAVIAVKVLRPERSAGRGWVEHLERELRHARKVQHPNVCRVYDFFEDDGYCFLTMELAAGGTLRDTLEAGQETRPLSERLTDARAILDGVAAIHAAGIAHRDIKPENILRGADGRLMVSDLGVAVRFDLTTQTGAAAGTRSYMAPELLFGEKATPVSDVWSLGIVLHEILFGQRPEWEGSGRERRLRQPGDVARPELASLFRMCWDCLSEDPTKRPTNAKAVADRLARALRATPKKVRRLAVIGGGVLAVIAVMGVLRLRTDRSTKSSAQAVSLTGVAVPLSRTARPIWTTNRHVRSCAQLLPGRTKLRLFLTEPAEAVDVDLSDGHGSPALLVPEAIQSGCAQVSPDGRRLLYDREPPGVRPEVMLSDSPDCMHRRIVIARIGRS